jgi:hypothetical protein
VLSLFVIGSHELIAQDQLGTAIFLFSDSQVARITGMNHQRPARISTASFYQVVKV